MSAGALPGLAVDSIVLGGIYILLAMGWVTIFRATRVLNFATGQIILLGALVYFTLTVGAGLPALLGLVGAVLITALIGGALFNLLLRALASQPVFAQVVQTLGMAILLGSVVPILWGSAPRTLRPALPDLVFRLPGRASITLLGIVTVVAGLGVLAILLLMLRRSRLGLQMEATAEKPLLASQTGIRVNVIATISWALAAAILTIGGIAYAQRTLVSPSLVDLGLRGLAPAMLGGLDSIRGVVAGAIIVAVVENLAISWLGGGVENMAASMVILVVLAMRPHGLFGAREVARV